MRRWPALIVVLVLGSSCGDGGNPPQDDPSASATPAGQVLAGTFTLNEGFYTDDPYPSALHKPENGTPCWGDGGYDDIAEGTAVVVRDESGTTIATGRLGPGQYSRPEGDCIFEFEVAAVPVAAFYDVEVSSRGALTYSSEDLEAAGWSVDFTLGEEP